MMKIVIFSTYKTDDGLFKGSNEMSVKRLSDFFFNSKIAYILNTAQRRKELEDLLLNEASNQAPTDKDTSLYNAIQQYDDKSSLIEVIQTQIETEISNKELGLLSSRIVFWGLEQDVDNITKDYSRSKLKQLDGQHVYAIKCLEPSERNDNWIPTLVNTAKDIMNVSDDLSDLVIYLVLHDKDHEDHVGEDSYVCSREEVKKLLLNKINNVKNIKIAFFSHTTNQFVEILGSSVGDNIIDNVHKAFTYYDSFQDLIKRSNTWLEKMGEDPNSNMKQQANAVYTGNDSWIKELNEINKELKIYD